jgi:arylsulfatase A-like enzyme
MFTGNYALTHGMGTNCDMYHSLSRELNDPFALLHRKMLEKNIRCGYIGKWHVGTTLGPRDYGFEGMNIPGYGNCKKDEEFLSYLDDNNLHYRITDPIYLNPGHNTLAAGVWDGPESSTTDWFLTDKCIDMLDAFSRDDSFVTLQYWGPHGPHLPPKNWVGKADRSAIRPWATYGEDLSSKPGFVRRHLEFYRNSPESWEGVREVIGLYYDYLMFIDSQIGRILDHLDEQGRLQDTVIAFTSDHGDMQWAHGGLIDKGFLYEEAMHVPLIFYHPDFTGGQVTDALVSNMDILPTFLHMLHIPCSCDGINIENQLFKKETGRSEFYMEFHGIQFLYTQRAIVAKEGWKFIWTPGDRDELYDLNADPYESDNLNDCKRYESIHEEMVRRLKKNAVRYNDPVMDYIYKIFGEWESPSGQIDVTTDRYNDFARK